MRAALAYELVRIRTIRSTWWLTGIAVGLGLLISTLLSFLLRSDSDVGVDGVDEIGAAVVTQLAAIGAPSLVSYLLAIVGILAWGHEYRHGMVRASLTAVSSRASLWTAKFVVVGGWVAGAVLLTTLLSTIPAALLLGNVIDIYTPTTFQAIGWQVLYGVLLAFIGMGFAAATRSQVLALVMLFLWPMLVESIIELVFNLVPSLRDDADVLRFLPFAAGRRMIEVIGSSDGTFGEPLSALGGALVFGLVAAALMTASLVLFRKRDA